jgi:hypothetical protein
MCCCCCCCCCCAVAVGIVENPLVHYPWMPMLPVCAWHIHTAGLQDAQSSPGAPARCGVCCLTCESQLNRNGSLHRAAAACLACSGMRAAVYMSPVPFEFSSGFNYWVASIRHQTVHSTSFTAAVHSIVTPPLLPLSRPDSVVLSVLQEPGSNPSVRHTLGVSLFAAVAQPESRSEPTLERRMSVP